MEHYRFFNSAEGDERLYLASDYAEYFSRFLSDGLYTENGQAGLKVAPGSGLSVSIEPGFGFIRGYMYHNDANLAKELDASDSMLDRIDRTVLRFDEVARTIGVVIKKGAFSSTPQAPSLEITSTVKELALAQTRIRKGATTILASDITDERLTANCGLVSSLITIPAQEMWDVWNSTLNQIEAAWTAHTSVVDNEWTNKKASVDIEWDSIQADWQTWFASRQNDIGLRVLAGPGPSEPSGIVAGDFWFEEV
ncbi:hypothetical protein [Desulfosporosinus sp.]|uniref:hypothetical protein n=1 Tax=Desulfosporosinus sp. TaxID=157907 RepID=UPI0025B98517|nr:hypothetical protein [Desulfosporosinus sp.]MBC2722347.1 hypothetical protein [Desulfosporosinus sp.]MBC2728619.1 hypothetical protein [Desulfosporosinus sp.]